MKSADDHVKRTGVAGWNVLMTSVKNGHVEVVDILCRHPYADVLAGMKCGITGRNPLASAIKSGYSDIAKRLVQLPSASKHAVNLDAVSTNALYCSLQTNQPDIALLLLELDSADDMAVSQTKHGFPVLGMALHGRFEPVALKLLSLKSAPLLMRDLHERLTLNVLAPAAQYGLLEVTRALIRSHPELASEISPNGWSALASALEYAPLEKRDQLAELIFSVSDPEMQIEVLNKQLNRPDLAQLAMKIYKNSRQKSHAGTQ